MTDTIVKGKSARIFITIVNIIRYFAAAFAFVYGVILVIFTFTPEGLFQTLENGGIILSGFSVSAKALLQAKNAGLPVWIGAVSAGLGAAIVWLFADVLLSFSNGKPFIEKNTKRLFCMGTLMLVQSYAAQGFHCVVAEGLLRLPGASGLITPYFSLLPDGAILAFGVITLAGVFRYGILLQGEHDSTV